MLFGYHQSMSCLLKIGIIAQNYKLILPKNSNVPIYVDLQTMLCCTKSQYLLNRDLREYHVI